MLRNIINALATAARTLFTNWKLAALFVGLYVAFVFSLYLFFTTPEARLWQVGLTVLLLLAAPLLFFVLQAMGVRYTEAEYQPGAGFKQAWRDGWKLLLISLPFIALVWLLVWGVNKLEAIGVTGIRDAANSSDQIRTGEERIKLINTVAATVNGLLMYFLLPLLSIQLWISTARNGFKASVKRLGGVLLRAFAPRAVITYLLGAVVFAVLPYFIVTMRTPIKSPWVDLTVLGLRIALALLVILVGWVITVGAIALLTPTTPQAAVKDAEPTTANAQAATV